MSSSIELCVKMVHCLEQLLCTIWEFVGSLIFIHFQRLRSHVNPTFVGVVGLDVPDVVPGEFVDGLLDLGQAALLAHPLRREVGVRASPAPLTLQ